jgi:hypothetical protein
MKSTAWLIVALAAIGCTPSASSTGTVTPGGNGPGDGPDPQGVQEGNSAAELKARLDRFSTQRQGLIEPASSDAAVCEDLCSLASSICEVKDKLCQVAEDRADQSEYRDLCREAQLECKDAQDSCINCVENNSSTQPPSQ